MMRAQGFDVIHYGVGDENPGATRHIQLFTRAEQEELLGHAHDDLTAFIGNDANVGNKMYVRFNEVLRDVLHENVAAEDVVCLPFGHAHQAGTTNHWGTNLESGVGYPICFSPFRVYESNAWASFHAGKEGSQGSDYQWVIPNYFDAKQWTLGTAPRKYLAFFGRICQIKGLDIVKEIAVQRPDLDVFICGQGDPTPWLDPKVPNVKYLPPKTGTDRSAFLGGAIALLAPSRYIEPFCGVTVEANLCGTPALTSNHGAFPETIQNDENGWRCNTLGDWLAGIRWAEGLIPVQQKRIRQNAVARYSLEAVGPQYTRVFEQIADLRDNGALGWYSPRSHIA